MITLSQLYEKYGTPNTNGTDYLTTISLPYPMIPSWEKQIHVNKMRCHKLIKDNFQSVFEDLLSTYGLEEIKRLRINSYGGCFAYRVMRNGSNLSRHSWGVAIDLDPERNALDETNATARFARLEYKPMIDIFYNRGFLSLGVEKNYDWMHFEIAT